MADAGAGAAPEEGAVKLEFQNFGSSGEGVPEGRIGKPAPNFNPPASDAFNSDKQSLLGSGTQQDGGARSWNPFSLSTFQYYFDVDTTDILDRLKRAVAVNNEVFFDENMRPDMYGPFWLCTTLIFTMAVAGNLGALMSFVPTEDNQVFTYNFSKLTVGSSVLYGYTALVPLAGWAVSKWLLSSPFGLWELICVYGYSLAIYIPAAIVCVVPIEILRWAVIAGAFVVSVRFITRNVKDVVMRELDDSKALVILLAVSGLHGALALFLKVYFYS